MMWDGLSVMLLGFFLGMRHATDPDHVIAVTTIVSRAPRVRSAALIGALWGVGHTFTILLVGGAILVFGLVIPPRVGLTMEFSVALMLILLGVLNLTGALQWVNEVFTAKSAQNELHSHLHSHHDYVHAHVHGHGPGAHGHDEQKTPLSAVDRMFGSLDPYQLIRPLIVGLVHGMAGSAAVALLVLATIRDPWWGVAYLLIFGVGTIVGMMLMTAAISVPFAYTGNRFSSFNRSLRLASGLLSLAFGLFLVYQIGFVDGLFTADPRWDPH